MTKILYLGTDPSRYGRDVIHCPLIDTRPLPLPDIDLDAFTHVILTSPNAARILASQMSLQNKKNLTIGVGTTDTLMQMGLKCFASAFPETQEGMINLLKRISFENSYLFYPRSSAARPLLANYLIETGLKHTICDLYETIFLKPHPLPLLSDFDEIVFTSPSTIKAFLTLYGSIPKNKKLTCIGPITRQALQNSG
ncbi:MAG: uroporphyrinogen-III synthase [Rhabdochlamydiaceae bacterium]